MKPTVLLLALLAAAAVSSPAAGQVFGHYAAASAVGEGWRSAGAYFTLADNTVGVLGQFRYGVSEQVSVGLQVGLDSVERKVFRGNFYDSREDTQTLLAGDVKYLARPADREIPVDVSLDFGVGLRDMDDGTSLLFSLGGQGGLQSRDDGGFSPYLGIVLLVDRSSLELPDGERVETEKDLEVRLGTTYGVTGSTSLIAELRAGNGTAFGVGLSAAF